MQFRFRLYDDNNDTYQLMGCCDIEDYEKAFQLFTFMKEHNCVSSIMINTQDLVERTGDFYEVIDVYFVSPQIGGLTLPHIAVDLTEAI